MQSGNYENRNERRFECQKIGPGGWNCVCCGPAPGKERKAFRRAAKRRMRILVRKNINKELTEDRV